MQVTQLQHVIITLFVLRSPSSVREQLTKNDLYYDQLISLIQVSNKAKKKSFRDWPVKWLSLCTYCCYYPTLEKQFGEWMDGWISAIGLEISNK